ncbi:hypothetical protein FOA52_007016 [Chlamydomonas sp. UWO 241]|nr:hypothetical protein FOA52_007016 [Chlamydomonas sp. UWO 241]
MTSKKGEGPQGDAGLRMLALAVTPGSPFRSYVAIKKHRSREGEQDYGPALFFSGVPLGFGEAAVGSVFECFGSVEQVVMHGNKRSGMVLFEAVEAVEAALQAAQSQALVEWSLPESDEPAGVKAWVHEHKSRRPGNKALQQRLDEWVAAFEAEEEQKERARTQAMAEDGWTVVTRGKGRAKTTEEGGMTVRSGGVAQAAARAKGDAKGTVQIEDAFYRFQAREKRRSTLLDLREQFDADKKRIAELRQSRKFKPY